jgi:IPT/TIG domain
MRAVLAHTVFSWSFEMPVMHAPVRVKPLLLALVLVWAMSGCRPAANNGADDAGVRQVPDAALAERPDSGVAPNPVRDGGVASQPSLERLSPSRAAASGGSLIVLRGSGFLSGVANSILAARQVTSILVGSNPVLDFQIIDDSTIEMRVPPGKAGRASVTLSNPNGRTVCNGCLTYVDVTEVTEVSPASGPLRGGNTVRISGRGLTAGSQVLFGEVSSPSLVGSDAGSLEVLVPPGVALGEVTVQVLNAGGKVTLPQGYRYVPSLQLDAIAPPTAPVEGGVQVKLRGDGLSSVSAIKFNGVLGSALALQTDQQLTVTVPKSLSGEGAVDITLESPSETRLFRGAFAYVQPAGGFKLLSVFPHVARAGETVALLGRSFTIGSLSVTIGGQVARVVSADATHALVEVPNRGGAPRKVDVQVTVGTLTETVLGGFVYRLKLDSVTPDFGPAAGGTMVTLSGQSFPQALAVQFGARPASLVKVTFEQLAEVVTEGGSTGALSPVSVSEVGDPENEDRLTQAFRFEGSLSVFQVEPNRGAISGNTLVTVSGEGFGPGTTVDFAGRRAKDIQVLSARTLICRTPAADAETVDVTVSKGASTQTVESAFTYFDARSSAGGLSGGPLRNTLNVSVLDATANAGGAPVEDATVIVGTERTTPFQGTTDRRGQITFSSDRLQGSQSVTAYKEGYDRVTVAAVNAENLTVFIARAGSFDANPGPPPPGVIAAQISGRVVGFKSPRPLVSGERLEARVFVAQTSLFGGAPFRGAPTRRGEIWKVTEDGGTYRIFSFPGLRAVYAVLGIVNKDDTEFLPVSMGIRRGVSTASDFPADNQNIVLDVPLESSLSVTVTGSLSLPADGGVTPATNSVYAWLDLGAEGFVPQPNNWATGTRAASSVTATAASLQYPQLPRLDGVSFVLMNEARGPGALPSSYAFTRQPGRLVDGATIGPMLPPIELLTPNASTAFDGTIRWRFSTANRPDIVNLRIVQVATGLSLWNVIAPGDATEVTVPRPALEGLLSLQKGNPLRVVMYASRSPKFQYEQWTYETLSGATWSSFASSESEVWVP